MSTSALAATAAPPSFAVLAGRAGNAPMTRVSLAYVEQRIDLYLRAEDADLYGEAVERRLRHLAQAMGLKYRMMNG